MLMGYRIAIGFSIGKAVQDCGATTTDGSEPAMRRANLFTIAAVLALCFVGAHCSPQTVTQDRTPVHVVHVDGDTVEILAALTDPAKLRQVLTEESIQEFLKESVHIEHEAG